MTRARRYLPTAQGRALAIVDQLAADTDGPPDWGLLASLFDDPAWRDGLRSAADRAGVMLDAPTRALVLSTLRARSTAR